MKLFSTLLCLVPAALAAYDSIPGSMFNNDPAQAARQACPFWFFGRSLNREPCYPESAVVNGGPHPGTPVRSDPSPGYGCPSPGHWSGTYSNGNPFPTYYNVKYCPGDQSWRINYNLYFSHDGMSGNGHRHDWEWVAVIWKRCGGSDMWCRNRLVRSFHSTQKSNNWSGIQNTINGKNELRRLGDKNKHHPLIYVGAFKHAMFDTRKTSMNVIGADELEFRSNDWWYFSQDWLVPGDQINRNWNYGAASSTPPKVWDDLCNK
ncbi:hypothetical protein FPQ18DRAFT_327623 [Pyronema domesticum]|uniref:Uncharacterized protein n=1 Tax=Pyronema omphalodes (strain CBS 100304) TaxID=1076935 RepID=U4L3X6_PYROM|nr:hypothetical protein FPQ18DRAFT_327623 [Pyronema domesticum]CCX07008.1 Similar to hypothetical protein VDAG_07972 [Verticillium dahliae VdLs.17]; acc. no. EGY16808 [Pyronema omphalodes CBS 100304]